MLESGEEQGTQGEDRDLGKSACGVGVPNIRGVLGSKKKKSPGNFHRKVIF